MEVADHYWGVLLILNCFLVLYVSGESGDINEPILTSTYQRGTKICKPVFNCHQGEQIKECVSSMMNETCEKCPGKEVQPDLISSVLKLQSHRKCFKLQEARCSTRDTLPAREKDGQTFCGKYCKCDITKCFWGKTACECERKKGGCLPNYQLNGITGDCEACPFLTYKHGDKCGPCEYNETAFRIYVNDIPTVSPVTPAATPAPTTPKVKPTTTPKPITVPPTKAGNHSNEEKGLSSVAIIVIAVLVVVLLILVGIMLILFCCYCRGIRCKEFLKRPFASGQVNGQQHGQPNGHVNGIHMNGLIPCDDKLYETMNTIHNHSNGVWETEPLVPPVPPPHPNHSPLRVSNQPSPINSQFPPTNGYVSPVGHGQAGLRVTLPRQVSHPVQDTTPHTPGSGGSSSLTNNFEAMNQYLTEDYFPPQPGISQEPIHARDGRISDGVDTDVKQQSSPIPCTEDNEIPNFPTNLSTEEFAHRNRIHFLPGAGALEHGENAAKENEEETQPKHGSQSANSSLQKTGNDHFVSLNQGTDKKHLIPNYTKVEKDKQAESFSAEGKVRDGANYIGDSKVSPSYVDMEKKTDSDFVDKDASQDEAYESVDASNCTKVTKDSSIASNHSNASGKS